MGMPLTIRRLTYCGTEDRRGTSSSPMQKKHLFAFLAGAAVLGGCTVNETPDTVIEDRTPDTTIIEDKKPDTIIIEDKKPDVIVTPPPSTTGGN